MKLTDDEVSKANGGSGTKESTSRECPWCHENIQGTEKDFNKHLMECVKKNYHMEKHDKPIGI